MFLGFFNLLWCFLFNKNLIRIEWNKVASFLGFLALLFCIRYSIFDIIKNINPQSIINIINNPTLRYIHPYKFLLVFWEDAFFGISSYWILKYFKKSISVPLVVLLSGVFGYGHLYQGLYAVICLSFYPFFVSRRYGLKNGFGTVMICHILFDFSTFLTFRLMPYML